jgi:hypothetical protein
MLSKPLETGKELVGHLEPGGAHVHEPRSGEIVQGPESSCRKDDGSLARVVGAGGGNWLTGFVAQQDPTLPIVKAPEPEAVGELQNGDDLLQARFGVKPRAYRGQPLASKLCFRAVIRRVPFLRSPPYLEGELAKGTTLLAV